MKKIISTDRAPQAIGPYSQAIECNNLIFCSGQIALNPRAGEPIEEGIKEQTRRVMENLKAVAEDAGSSLNNALKATIYLTDLGDFQTVNEIYGGYFSDNPPARTTIVVSALPKGAKIEIDLICYK